MWKKSLWDACVQGISDASLEKEAVFLGICLPEVQQGEQGALLIQIEFPVSKPSGSETAFCVEVGIYSDLFHTMC